MNKILSPLYDTDQGRLRYIYVASLYSTLPALTLGYVFFAIFPNLEAPEFPTNALFLLVFVVIISPLLETLLMWPLLALLSRFLRSTLVVAIFSGLVWAVLHSLSAPIWGVAIFFSFVVFSIAFVEWRKKSRKEAFGVTCGIHATQNTIASILILLGG